MRYFLLFLCLNLQAATYYVAPRWGNNTAAGTAITNAVKNLSYALNTLAAAGDTIVISPEGPILECINLTQGFATAPVTIFGDCLNTNGFTNLTGVKVPAGVVVWSNYTNGLTAFPPQDDCFDMNSRSNIVLHSLYIHAQSPGAVRAVKANSSRKLYATNCTFFSSSIYAVDFTTTIADGFYAYFDSCTFLTGAYAYALYFAGDGVGSTDWDMKVETKNCIFYSFAVSGGGGNKSGAAAGTFGGWKSTNDLWFGGILCNNTSTNNFPFIIESGIVRGVSSIQNTGQVQFYRSVINGGSGAFNNIHLGNSALKIQTNNYDPIFNAGHMKTIGMGSANFFTPLPFSPIVGYGATNLVTKDMYNKTRPQPVTPGPIEVRYAPARSY